METDLGMAGTNFNSVNSIFYISYITFGIPLNLLCKMVGPGWYLPIVTIAFGLTSICTAYVHNFAGLAGVRFTLGIFEAAVMPGIAYYVVCHERSLFTLLCYANWYFHRVLSS